MLLGLVLSIVAGLGAVQLYRDRFQPPAPEPMPVVRAPRNQPTAADQPTPAPAPDPLAIGSAEPDPQPVEPEASTAGESVASSTPGRRPFLDFADAEGGFSPRLNLPFVLAHFTSGAEECEPTEVGAAHEEIAAGDREVREQTLAASDMVLLPAVLSPFREASDSDMALIWRGSAVPMEAIDEPRKLVTPDVGGVRVFLYGGETFEGRLYAVGERKVWLELNGARMALLSWQVQRIEHIATGGPLAAIQTDLLAQGPLDRVRVRTAGGVFYGRLVKRDGDNVTILTAEGARMTVSNATVEPAGTSQTRIVDASNPDEPPAPAPRTPR